MVNKRTDPNFFLLVIFICFSVFYPLTSAAQGADEENKKEKTLEDLIGDVIPIFVDKKIGKLELDFSASAVTGFDTNVNLDRYDEDGSIFAQGTLGIEGEYPLSDTFKLKGGYDFTAIKYFKFSDPDLVDNLLTAGLDTKLDENFLWSLEYEADFLGFPHDSASKYKSSEVGTFLRQQITDWLYQRIGYQFLYKYYIKWKTRNNWGRERLRNRKDFRNTAIYQLGAYLGDRTFIKSDTRASLNNSNELYLDYYDYRSLKTKLSITHLITDTLYELVSCGYQYKAYNKRGVSDDVVDQRDHLFTYTGSLFYDIMPSVSVGLTVDFRKNYSNENDQQYEDFIVSSGVYCSF